MGEPIPLLFDDPPFRLSGIVYGTLLNQRESLNRLGDAVNQPPYKAAPKAPVLYMKPRNTLARDGDWIPMPDQVDALQLGATLGLVIGRPASRVATADALSHVAGVVLMADLRVPHDSFYRPSVRHIARDRSCVLGPRIVPLDQAGDPDQASLVVEVDGRFRQAASMSDMMRPSAVLLADVTEFMTLLPGDVLMLGLCADMPALHRGQRFQICAERIGQLQGAIA